MEGPAGCGGGCGGEVKEKLGCRDTPQEEWRRRGLEDMNKGAAEMDEGSGERQRRDRDGWSEQHPGLYGGHGCTGGDESSRRCTEERRSEGRRLLEK